MAKHLNYLFPTAFFTLSSALFAQGCDPCNDLCIPLCPSSVPDWEITPNAGPFVLNGADIFLTGEFTYWTMRQDHMGFAVKNEEVTETTIVTSDTGSVFHPDSNFRPGFKAGLGITFDCDGWDLYANYTWFRARDTRKTAIASGTKQVIDLNWAVLPNNNTFSQVQPGRIFTYTWSISQGKWELDFNVVDLELGRNFFISPCLQLRPYFGLKGTWQKQQMDVDVFGTPDSMTNVMFNATGEYCLTYWGV